MKKYTPENITDLKPNEVFVFGSNMNGNHAGGAARVAVEKFGAIMGQAEGIQGQSYAIPTLDKDMQKVDLDTLQKSLFRFCQFANDNQNKTFYLTKIGLGIAGFTLDEILSVINRVDIPDNVIIPEEFDVICGFKGFEKDMTCLGFQYEVGKDYKEKDAECCSTGFHFCKNPMDVLGYYSPADENGNERRYCTVQGSGKMDKNSDKVACSKLHISGEIGLSGLIKAGVKFIFDRVKWEDNPATNTGDRSAATNTGYQSAATNTGDQSAATVSGKDSIAIVTGKDSKARGAKGCWIVLTERGDWNGNTYPIKEVKAFEVDGVNIKENTFYKLVDGKAVEVE